VRVAVDGLREAMEALLKTMGAHEQEAWIVAESLIKADLRGTHSHGCTYFPLITERIAKGFINIPTQLRQIADEGAIAHMDGNNGLGQAAAAEAMRKSISKAKAYGIGLTLIRNTNNIGFLGFYSLMATSEQMIGICACNAASAIAPWGGAEPFFGTNPFSIGIPVANQAPIVLDMSASMVARGKIRRAEKLNESIPMGWALDETGAPTTDPAEALKGSLLPIAGPKGYGIAFLIDLVCGLLSGSKFGRDVVTFHKLLGPTGVGVMTMALDITRFMPLSRFEALISGYADDLRNSQKADGIERIFLPGEIESESEHVASSRGVEVDSQVILKINQLLEEKNLPICIEENG